MKKFLSLLKAILSQDMNLFRYKNKVNSSKLNKVLLPVFFSLIIMFSIGTYCYTMAEMLSPMGLTHIMLTMFMLMVSILAFMQGIYKSQGILFDSKDNDLLFSLPIKKSTIFALRITKLLIFQFLYNMLFVLPSIVVYAYFASPGISFYLLSALMCVLLPIIPTIVSSILGYAVKGLSFKFKAKRIAQTILSSLVLIGVMLLSFNLQNVMNKVAENASSINDVITRIYYPVGVYIELIQKFDLLKLIELIAVNVIPFVMTVYIGAIYYFKVISKSSESGSAKSSKIKKNYKKNRQIKALVSKELKKYFSSSTYMFNTLVGVIIMFILTIAMCINTEGTINAALAGEGIEEDIQFIMNYLPKVFIQFVVFVGCMTSITSSSISLEGKSFNITKSLPVNPEKILLSKVITSNIISLPLMIISDIIFAVKFNLQLTDIILILGYTVLIPTYSALIGLIVNLKYPKMEWTSDTEVVKQSMSTMISVWIGMITFGVSVFLMIKYINHLKLFNIFELVAFALLDIILYFILKIYGKKKINKINV